MDAPSALGSRARLARRAAPAVLSGLGGGGTRSRRRRVSDGRCHGSTAAARWLPTAAWLRALAARYDVDVEAYAYQLSAARAEIVVLGAVAAGVSVLCARALRQSRWRHAALATAGLVACATLLARDVFIPALVAQKSVRPFAVAVHECVGPSERLELLSAAEEIPFIFYVGRDVPVRGAPGREPPAVGPGYYVLDQAGWERWHQPAGWEEVLRSPHLFSRHRRDLLLVHYR
jgi:hypothetical protein